MYCLTKEHSKLQKRYQKTNAVNQKIMFDIIFLIVKSWDPVAAIFNLIQNIFGHFNFDTKYLENNIFSEKMFQIKIVGPLKGLFWT